MAKRLPREPLCCIMYCILQVERLLTVIGLSATNTLGSGIIARLVMFTSVEIYFNIICSIGYSLPSASDSDFPYTLKPICLYKPAA